MKHLLLAARVLILACSEPDPGGAGVAETNASAPHPETAAPPRGAAAAPEDARTLPTPGELRTFKDWIVGCDNTRACQASALGPEAEFPDLLIAIGREGGPQGALTVTVYGHEALSAPVTLSVDGRQVASGGTTAGSGVDFTGADAMRIAEALAGGQTAQIKAGGRTVPLSTAGVSAALRYIDAKQGRAGTRGALVAKGPAADVAAAPAPPVIRAAVRAGTPAPLSEDLVASLRKQAGCGIAGYIDPPPAAEAHALAGGRTLVLVPCDSGAYNLMSALFILEDGRAVPARLDAPTGFGPERPLVPQVVNASFEDGVLQTYVKGRGLGDCGIVQEFVWDGQMLRLSRQEEMTECRGATAYITTWRANVVR